MLQQQQTRTNSRGEAYVIGPTGAPLTKNDLPPPNTGRWVIRRKAEVVAAVRGGLISLEEALERYSLTNDEFLSWQRSIERHPCHELRVHVLLHVAADLPDARVGFSPTGDDVIGEGGQRPPRLGIEAVTGSSEDPSGTPP